LNSFTNDDRRDWGKGQKTKDQETQKDPKKTKTMRGQKHERKENKTAPFPI
jgi:hypothetical protein